MFLLPLLGDGVLVTEDEVHLPSKRLSWAHRCPMALTRTNLGTRAGQIRTEHDDPRSSVAELLVGQGICFQEFDVSTTAVADFLEFGFILDDEGLALGVDWLCDGSRDGVVSGLVFGDESLVADDGDLFERFLNGPFANVGEGLSADGGLFSCLGWSPAFLPVAGELFEERGFDSGGLYGTRQGQRTSPSVAGASLPHCSGIGAVSDIEARSPQSLVSGSSTRPYDAMDGASRSVLGRG